MKNSVLVVGGAGGIGSAIVKTFLNENYSVVVADIDKERGEALCKEYPDKAIYIETDVVDTNSLDKLILDILEKKISLNHIVSLAGGALEKEFSGIEAIDSQDIKKSIDLNLTSHIIMLKKALNLLISSEEVNKSITLISSINAKMDFGLPAYSAAKSGLIGITKVLAADLGKYGIRVNVVLPGTTITQRTLKEPKVFDEYIKGTLLGRFATETEIASVVFCIANKLTCITGQEIIADCGQTVKGYYENN